MTEMAAAAAYEEPVEDRPHYLPDRYPWIRAWGQLCRYDQETVESQLARAETENAPPDACYRFNTEPWVTLKEIVRVEARIWLVDWAESRDLAIPPSALRIWLDPYVPVEP